MLCWRAVTTCCFYDHDLGEGVIFPCLFNYSRQQNGETKVLCCSFKPDVLLSHPSWQQLLCYKVIWQSHQVLAQLLTNSLDFNQFVTRRGKCSLWTEFTSLSRDLGWRAQVWFYIQTFSGQLQKKNAWINTEVMIIAITITAVLSLSLLLPLLVLSSHRHGALSFFTFTSLPVCSSCMCVCADPPSSRYLLYLFALSWTETHQRSAELQENPPPSWPAASTPAFLGFFFFRTPPPSISLIICLRQRWQTSAPAVVTILPPPCLSLSLSLSRSLSCVVKMATQWSAALLQYHKIKRWKIKMHMHM